MTHETIAYEKRARLAQNQRITNAVLAEAGRCMGLGDFEAYRRHREHLHLLQQDRARLLAN